MVIKFLVRDFWKIGKLLVNLKKIDIKLKFIVEINIVIIFLIFEFNIIVLILYD